eukprot:4359489-Prymnesium_polylepis.1
MLRLGLLALLLGQSDAFSASLDDCPNKAYSQCGGKGFTGATCCPPGYTCKGDQYYAQCTSSAPPKLACETDSDCTSGQKCVILPDRSFAQCIDCSSFASTCGSFAAKLLVAVEAACGVSSCAGRCPLHTDSECATGQKCAVSSDGSQDKCLDCGDDALFGKECWALAPESYLTAGLGLCGRTSCPGRCPNHTDAECSAGLTCVVQGDGGYWDRALANCEPAPTPRPRARRAIAVARWRAVAR